MPAKAEYEKTSYGAFERFLYLFFIPIIFSAILTFVMLHIFGINVMDTALTVGNKIPFIEKIVPEPKSDEAIKVNEEENVKANDEASLMVVELKTKLNNQTQLNKQKDTEIVELQQTIEELKEELNIKSLNDEEYFLRIRKLASMYADMTPKNAAAIFNNLTLNERVLVLNEMLPENQINILEKMDPATAAETSILLKDQIMAKDQQIAALQERLSLHDEAAATSLLSTEELSLTFASMTPANAAVVLLEMIAISEEKVIAIMRSMDVQARSQILNAITNLSESEAAKLSAKLG